jgi:hypothetical protein
MAMAMPWFLLLSDIQKIQFSVQNLLHCSYPFHSSDVHISCNYCSGMVTYLHMVYGGT